jgi:hypothetical protein
MMRLPCRHLSLPKRLWQPGGAYPHLKRVVWVQEEPFNGPEFHAPAPAPAPGKFTLHYWPGEFQPGRNRPRCTASTSGIDQQPSFEKQTETRSVIKERD